EEKQILQRIGYVMDPHIVRMVKTYKHGDSFNIVFPLAKTNLDDYLRKVEPHQAEKHLTGSVAKCTFWIQLRGITRALSKVHNIDQFESTSPTMAGRRSSNVPKDVGGDSQRAFGIHSDLKPANILVEEDDKWVISDFGQATFRNLRSRDETSSIENRGGSITYAPPEYDDGIHKRSFDIFSLGIIFLEVAAFVIRSYPGLTSEDRDHPGLDKARITEDSGPHGGENHRFYLMDQSRNYRLKEEIGDFMDDLQCDVDKGSSDHLFVTDLFRLIRRMLSCTPSGRPLATEVEQELSRLIKDYGNEANDFQTEILQKTHRER
ncbi:G-type lectin S-receptor-like serine/threonine-protein kinase, partial [Diplodia seriata]